MRSRPARLVRAATLLAFVALVGGVGASALPDRLSDADFWKLEQDISEPGGYFRIADNYTSNEREIGQIFTLLEEKGISGGVYMGVGPEQNLTYIAAIKPAMAFVVDIRRQAVMQHLMYKAMFELAKDRAEFLSMLFAKPRPAGLTAASTATELFSAFGSVSTSEPLFKQTLTRLTDHLTKTHGFGLAANNDLAGLEAVYQTFYWSGFAVRASPTYADLMTATDAQGVNRSYLASEGNFAVLKDLETRNLVVPVVGDFGGPKAIRAVGAYLKSLGGQVSAFYLSNVEDYLAQDGKMDAFC